MDDQPTWIHAPQPVLSVSYTLEIYDIPKMGLQHHPERTGVPHRMGYFEQWLDTVLANRNASFMTGEGIANCCSGQISPPTSTNA